MFYVLALIVIAFLALVTFLVVKLLSRADRSEAKTETIATVRGDLGDSKLETERLKFELGQAKNALATERVRADALESYVEKASQSHTQNGDLEAADAATRLQRLSQELAAASAEAHPRGPVRGGPEPAVPPNPAPALGDGTGPDSLLKPE